MKKRDWRWGLLLALLGGVPLPAGAGEPEVGPLDPSGYPTPVLTEEIVSESPSDDGLFSWSGYWNAGYFGNVHGARTNGNVNSSSQNIGAMNGLYASLTKEAATQDCGADWGAGVDLMFGEDSRFLRVQNGLDETWITGHDRDGNATYGFAMPQLYGELAVNHLSIKGGHFYTPFGYEGAKATDRFFYSRGLSFDGLPVTHTGAFATYDALKKVVLSVGWVNGIDQGFSHEAGGSLVIGQLGWTISDKMSLKYTFGAGDIQDQILDDGSSAHEYGSLHTWVLEFAPNDCWTLVTTADYMDRTTEGVNGYTGTVLGQHLYYKANACWKFGTRVEWQKLDYSDKNDSQERVALSVGPNWSPNASEHFMIRPEIRYDSDSWKSYGRNANRNDQLCLGIDLLGQY